MEWELDHKENWLWKNWCLYTVVLEKTLESSLDSKKIKPVNPKGNQPWIFIGRTDVETEAPILWPPDAKSLFIRKDLMLGKIEGRRRRGWLRMRWLKTQLNGHDFEQALGDGEEQGSLVFCSPWGCKESDMTSGWATTIYRVPSIVNDVLIPPFQSLCLYFSCLITLAKTANTMLNKFVKFFVSFLILK